MGCDHGLRGLLQRRRGQGPPLPYSASAERMMHPARFPPSFDDRPLGYAFALFSLALITSLSLAILTGYALEHRRECEINRRIGNKAYPPRYHGLTLIGLHRLIVSGLLLTIVFGALPDVPSLLAWGGGPEGGRWAG